MNEQRTDIPMTGGKRALSRGTTQTGVRLYNERLALSLVRLHGTLPKAEIARLTGLSAQTVSVIVRQLESDGLLKRRKPQRGKVGQPLVPFELNPEGAFSIGLKVGRRSGDLVLLDLAGKVRNRIHRPYSFPSPSELLSFAKSGVEELISGLAPAQALRITGLGIAAPFELWNWAEEVGAPADVLAAWRALTSRARSRGCSTGRCSSATMPPPPAPQNSSSAADRTCAISPISISAISSAAAWC